MAPAIEMGHMTWDGASQELPRYRNALAQNMKTIHSFYREQAISSLLPKKYLSSVTFVYDQQPDPFSDHRPGFQIRTLNLYAKDAATFNNLVGRTMRCSRLEVLGPVAES